MASKTTIAWLLALGVCMVSKSSAQECITPPSGLVGWWAGDNHSGDISTGQNHAAAHDINYAEGKVESTFVFDGASSSLVVAEVPDLTVESLTIDAWIYPTEIDQRPIVEYADPGILAGAHFWIGTHAEGAVGWTEPGALYANLRESAYVNHIIQVPHVIKSNEWSFVALTYDQPTGIARLYVNGEIVKEAELGSFTPDTGRQINIGSRPGSFAEAGPEVSFSGNLDEVEIFNRALAPEEILEIYAAGSAGKCKPPMGLDCVTPPAGLVGWWSGDDHANDLTMNQNDGTLQNVYYTNGVVANGFFFHGYDTAVTVPASPELAVQSLTWDAWVFPLNDGAMPVIEYGNENEYAGAHLWLGARALGVDAGALYVNLREGPYDNHIIEAKEVIQANAWNFVAVTYDQASGIAQLFVNGEVVQESNFGVITPLTGKRLNIGQRPETSGDGSAGSYFAGVIDEAEVYNRALTAAEILAIYEAGAAGKCKTGTPPGCGPEGLVGWWSGDNHLGDLSGHQPDAVGTNIVYVPGHDAAGIQFDGVNSAVTLPPSNTLAVESLTFDVWIRPTEHTQRPLVEYTDENDWAGAHFWIGTHAEGTIGRDEPGALYANLRDFAAGNHIIQVADVIPTNEWSFVALTYDKPSGLARLYVNGELVKEENLGSFTPDTTGQLNIGSRPLSSSDGSNGRRFAGVLDEVEIFNRALTAEEILGIYENGKCKVELPLVSIEFVPESGDPAWPDEDYAPGLVEVRRTGDTSAELVVHYAVSGTATAAVDYGDLPGVVTIPAGEEAVQFPVEALDDELSEGAETVVLTLTRQLPDAKYYIDSTLASAHVTIVDNEPAPVERVVLALQVVDSTASEPGIQANDAVVLVRRVSGPLNVPVTAQISLGGTAENGVDYETLGETVELPPGSGYAQILIRPLADGVTEFSESVTLTLLAPDCEEGNQDPGCYLVGTPSAGQVVIRDAMGGVNPPVVKVVQPVNGSVFLQEQMVQLKAEASDSDGFIRRLEILVDGRPVGMTNSNTLTVNWLALPGEHAISARALDDRNLISVSPVVRILVREFHGQAFITRDLPVGYTPGVAFPVSLVAEPSFGSNAYAIEDEPPAGWEVTAVSQGGVFDAVNGKVKFGPYTDDRTRVLSYQVRPPAGATGLHEFSGVGSIDGQAYPVAGDQVINTAPSYHPADTNEDYRIELLELTAYASAWKEGEQSIPLSYLTRAALLWRSGEAYEFNGAVGVPPFCWVSAGPQELAAAAFEAGQAGRSFSGTPTAGGSLTVSVLVTPPSGASGYAVEEVIPAGWVVGTISHEGEFDAAAGVIRWGLFMDADARTLSYTLVAPAEISAGAVLEGEASFDGAVVKVTGAGALGNLASAGPEVWFEAIETTAEGDVLVRISGAPGQICVLETSADLSAWAELATTFLPDGTLEYLDEQVEAKDHRYYRVRLSN